MQRQREAMSNLSGDIASNPTKIPTQYLHIIATVPVGSVNSSSHEQGLQ
jgi:hypothetical protein